VRIPNFDKSFFLNLQSDEKALASNLTYTLLDFSNKFHKDEDFQSYAYGIWISTKFHNGELASKKDGFSCMGGEFLLPNYDIHIDFGTCNEITELIWRAQTYSHRTCPSRTRKIFIRIETSIQINRILLKRIKSLVSQGETGFDVNTKILDVGKIISQKSQYL